MKDNPEIFFGHLLELGAGEYDYFTRFKDSQIVEAVEYSNIVSGICAMFVMEDEQVQVILEARMPKRISKKILEDLLFKRHSDGKRHSDRIASKIDMALEWQEPSEKYGCYRISITHKFPSIKTDRTFNKFLESLTSSMNEMVMALRSYE